MKHCIVTGSGGLVGSESVRFFLKKGYTVIGIDNDMRAYFFGTSTKSVSDTLTTTFGDSYVHYTIDIRNMNELDGLFSKYASTIDCIIHCAAQPSHDWAAKEPLTDFTINATATLNLLELTRKYCAKASFIFMSTNKVYGDTPNTLPIVELEKRYEVTSYEIDETMSVDQCKHSIFGVSKLSADIMVQEYGRYFGMNTVVFRGGCITGPNHQGAQLHGFLSYLVRCIAEDKPYTIFGYKGKQVRDNIHAYDLVNAFWHYHHNPKPASVYNMGGGRENAVSILEAIEKINTILNKNWKNFTYLDDNRSGDHIWYISSLKKFQKEYPEWKLKYSIDDTIKEIARNFSQITVTSKLLGGVGNQMFQIALAYTTAKQQNAKLKFIRQQFDGCRQGSHPSKYYTNLFQKLDFVDSLAIDHEINERGFVAYPIENEVKTLLERNEKNRNLTLSFKGYFQSDRYFNEYSSDIKELFTPYGGIISYLKKNSELFSIFPELESNNNYCFMGVRRGDYITHSDVHNPCGMTFYNGAMSHMQKERYYILSDDIEWCKQNFVGDQYRYFEIKDDLIQLFASCLFKNYIISNSTFYWWGSFLSIYDSPRIIAPDKWLFGKDVTPDKYYTIYRKSMEILERPIETT